MLRKKHDAFCLLVKTHSTDKFGSPGIAYGTQASIIPPVTTNSEQEGSGSSRTKSLTLLSITKVPQSDQFNTKQMNKVTTSRKLKENRKAYHTQDLF